VKRLGFILGLVLCWQTFAAEVIPPSPTKHFNDYAGITSRTTAERLDRQLEDFERETSNQILVAVYPKMESESSIDDYVVRVFRSWKVGQKDKNNGAVLFVFTNDRKMFIMTGYGLEGALPDVTCKRIVADEITPRFKSGDYNGGLSAGVAAMIAATKGEYKGTGRTVGRSRNSPPANIWLIIAVFIVIVILSSIFRRRGGYGGGWWLGGGGFGGFSGGGGGGDGGFSGGGGSTGGGGAGGSW
jgi:uncharacterized protein